MDILTHIFLPLTVLYILKKEWFNPPYHLALVLFTIFPDFDKFIGIPGIFHSFFTLVPLILVLFIFEKLAKGSGIYTSIAAFFIFSHLFLDFLDASPIFPLYPLIKTGVMLKFPLEISFHNFGFSFVGPLIQIIYTELKAGFNTYEGILSGFGVVSMLLFVMVYIGTRKRWFFIR